MTIGRFTISFFHFVPDDLLRRGQLKLAINILDYDFGGVDGGGSVAKESGYLRVVGKHTLAVGFIVKQTRKFFSHFVHCEMQCEFFADSLAPEDDVGQSEKTHFEERSPEESEQSRAAHMIDRHLRAAEQSRFESSRTGVDDGRMRVRDK